MRALARCVLIGALAAAAWGQTTGVTLDGRESAVQETNLGNLVADALRTQAQAQLAFIPASYLKPALIPAGSLSAATQAAMLVYPDDKVVVASLKGEQVRAALERSVSLEPLPNKGFLQVSGLVFWFDQGAPPGSRVVRILVADGKPLELTASYRVAMPVGLAKGALGYFRVFASTPVTDTGFTTLAALSAHLDDRRVSPAVEGRIRKLSAAR